MRRSTTKRSALTSADGVLRALLAVVVLATAAAWSGEVPHLVVRDQRSEAVYHRAPIVDGQRVSLTWIHSIERTPWTEIYEVDGDELVLVEIELESYGAGVPHDGGTTRVEDGIIHVTDLHQRVDDVRWFHSTKVGHTVALDGETIVGPDEIPHHNLAQIVIEPR